MFDIPKKYILKNISQYDINISDLGIRIPFKQSKDLLESKYNLSWIKIMKSRVKGSVGLRLKKGMILEELNYNSEEENKKNYENNEEENKNILEVESLLNNLTFSNSIKKEEKNIFEKYDVLNYLKFSNNLLNSKKVLVLHYSQDFFDKKFVNQLGLLDGFENCGFNTIGFNFNTFFRRFDFKIFNEVFYYIVEKFTPDWIHIQSSFYNHIFDLETIKKITSNFPHIHISSWGPDIRLEINSFYVNLGKLIDKPLICSEGQLDDFREKGCSRIDYWQVGIDPKHFYRKQEIERELLREKYKHDISGCINGGIMKILPERENRTKLLEKLYLNKKHSVHLYGIRWEKLDKNFKPLDFYEQNDVYNGSKIVISMNCVNNVRKYFSNRQLISMAAGTMVLSKYIPGLEDYFENHKHLVWFKTEEEFFDLIDYYLEHEKEREEVGKNGAKIILEKHTYFQRVNELSYRCGFLSKEQFIENSKKIL